jgi:hypothetical protein
MHDSWSPFSLPPIGMVLVTLGVLVIGIAAVNWSSQDEARVAMLMASTGPSAAGSAAPAMPLSPAPAASVPKIVPVPSAIVRCNRYAASRVGHKDMRALAVESVPTDSIFSGALYGLDESRKNDDRYRLAYASCMRARGYTR